MRLSTAMRPMSTPSAHIMHAITIAGMAITSTAPRSGLRKRRERKRASMSELLGEAHDGGGRDVVRHDQSETGCGRNDRMDAPGVRDGDREALHRVGNARA